MEDKIIALLRRYRVTFSMRMGHTHGTASSTPHYDVTVTIENDGRKLSGYAWGKSEQAALDEAFLKVARQAEALDELE